MQGDPAQETQNSASSKGVSKSYLYLWRSVFALAQGLGMVDASEMSRLESFLQKIPFSEEQRNLLQQDLLEEQDLGLMLTEISQPEDQSKFFQFARMLYWCEGDLYMQEQMIMKAFLVREMQNHEIGHLRKALRISQQSATIRKLLKNPEYHTGSLKLSTLLIRVFPSLEVHEEVADVPESEFYMWRSLFALAHADGIVTAEERNFLNNTLNHNQFTKEQRLLLEDDLVHPQNVEVMFQKITLQEHRSRFFYLARLLCWCDGDFDKQEQDIMERLHSSHLQSVDFDTMVKNVTLELEEEPQQTVTMAPTEEDDDGDGGPAGFFARLFGKKKKK